MAGKESSAQADETKDNVIAPDLNSGSEKESQANQAIEKASAFANKKQAENWLKGVYISLVNLKIETVVTDKPDRTVKSIQTTINLVEGDIKTEIHQYFAKDLDVFEFHKEQVKNAEAIIKSNVETVKAMAEGLLDLFTG